MTASERRIQLVTLLAQSDTPVSASALATHFSVSRQLIVGDIALLRASGSSITATPRGYVLDPVERTAQGCEQTIACTHAEDRLAEEIYTIVDLGGTLLDVTVEHSVYGQICAPLHISSRYDADLFLQKLQNSSAKPLCDLTDGVHLHRIRCVDTQAMLRITNALRERGLLFGELAD